MKRVIAVVFATAFAVLASGGCTLHGADPSSAGSPSAGTASGGAGGGGGY